MNLCVNTYQYDLALAIGTRWMREHPADAHSYAFCAAIAMRLDAPRLVLRLASEALARDPASAGERHRHEAEAALAK